MTIPDNGQVSRGADPFSSGPRSGQIFRFFTDVDTDGKTRHLVEVLQAGDKLSAPVRIVTPEWLAENHHAAMAYEQWTAGRSIENGTPLDAWAGADRATCSSCAVLNIYTVEQLAALDDERALRLGMGGRGLVAKAKTYLESRADAQAAERIHAERTAQAGAIANLQAVTEQQSKVIAELLAEREASRADKAPTPASDVTPEPVAPPSPAPAPVKRPPQPPRPAA
jgi:hypothetical protein